MTNSVMRADGVAVAHNHFRTPTRRIPLRRKDAAKYVQDVHGQPCSPKTLAKLVVVGGGPAYRKAGKFPLYEPDDLDEWALAKLSPKVRSSSEIRASERRTVALDAKRGAVDGIEDAIGTSLDEGDEVDALILLPADTRDALIKQARDGERVSAKTEAKKVKREQRERELGAKIVALPQKKYGVIVADPEWRFEPWSRETGMDRSADNHYPTSGLDVIKARDVPSIAANDCVLFLWATVPMLQQALEVIAAWGFDYRSHYIWNKDRIGTGYWSRNRHELLLIGVKGRIPAPAPGTQWPSVVDGPVGEHSAKPDCFLEMIEAYFPNIPKIELNARLGRKNWDSWGLEAPTTEDAAE